MPENQVNLELIFSILILSFSKHSKKTPEAPERRPDRLKTCPRKANFHTLLEQIRENILDFIRSLTQKKSFINKNLCS